MKDAFVYAERAFVKFCGKWRGKVERGEDRDGRYHDWVSRYGDKPPLPKLIEGAGSASNLLWS